MGMREQIQALINSNYTAYRISKDTGITLSVIQKIMDGTSKLDNISLKNAEILSAYWEKQKTKGNEQGFEKGFEDLDIAIGFYWEDSIGRWKKF